MNNKETALLVGIGIIIFAAGLVTGSVFVNSIAPVGYNSKPQIVKLGEDFVFLSQQPSGEVSVKWNFTVDSFKAFIEREGVRTVFEWEVKIGDYDPMLSSGQKANRHYFMYWLYWYEVQIFTFSDAEIY
jgi:hypothetical protein